MSETTPDDAHWRKRLIKLQLFTTFIKMIYHLRWDLFAQYDYLLSVKYKYQIKVRKVIFVLPVWLSYFSIIVVW